MATESRLRLAYELGRVRLGLLRALAVFPLAAVALALRDDWRAVILVGVAAQLVIVAFTWSGGWLARSVWPGMLAGAAPLVLPLITLAASSPSHACRECSPSDVLHLLCIGACVAGGIAAGAVVGWRAARLPEGRLPFAAGAATIATLVGAMGCAEVGPMGMAGVIIGLVAGGTPILLFRQGGRRA
jgi:hypothetical protein